MIAHNRWLLLRLAILVLFGMAAASQVRRVEDYSRAGEPCYRVRGLLVGVRTGRIEVAW